jgi:hypothetical protein
MPPAVKMESATATPPVKVQRPHHTASIHVLALLSYLF